MNLLDNKINTSLKKLNNLTKKESQLEEVCQIKLFGMGIPFI